MKYLINNLRCQLLKYHHTHQKNFKIYDSSLEGNKNQKPITNLTYNRPKKIWNYNPFKFFHFYNLSPYGHVYKLINLIIRSINSVVI